LTLADRERLLRRIRQIRGAAVARENQGEEAESDPAVASDPARIQALEARVAHLEELLEGLQDSVHRESERQSRLIAELQAQVEPSAMSAALALHARHRGL
jgi:predicted RNase H-like nuclease (RuvC/YqgF family)